MTFLAIDTEDSLQQAKAFIENNEYTFPVLLDSGYEASDAYGIYGVPMSFLIDRDGIIQRVKYGAYQSIEEIETNLQSIMF